MLKQEQGKHPHNEEKEQKEIEEVRRLLWEVPDTVIEHDSLEAELVSVEHQVSNKHHHHPQSQHSQQYPQPERPIEHTISSMDYSLLIMNAKIIMTKQQIIPTTCAI